jgi:hypothetical protein
MTAGSRLHALIRCLVYMRGLTRYFHVAEPGLYPGVEARF